MARRFNVVAAFPDKRKAERAVERLTETGVKKSNVHVLRPGIEHRPDRAAELQDEVAAGVEGSGTLVQAKSTVDGMFVGTLIGGLVGLVAGLFWAFLGSGPLGTTGRALIAFVPFAVGGAVSGAIAGAATKPRASVRAERGLDDPVLDAERDTIVAVDVSGPNTAEEAQHLLEELGAERVDAITADGTPLPPRSAPRKRDRPNSGRSNRGWLPGDSGR